MSLAGFAPEHIRRISPYVPGKPIAELARELGLDEASIVKLASNENPLGMGPLATQAMQAALRDLARYPDGSAHVLRSTLAQRLGVTPDMLVLGNGSNDILELAARTVLSAQASAIHAQFAFAVYPLAIQAMGARAIEVPARAFGHDLAAIADAIAPDTRLVFIANPNNPTGTFLPAAMIEDFLARVPPHVVVVLDEAYNEYLPECVRYDSVAWLQHFPNLLITRTFSKIHGLAGLRVGYGIARPALAELMNRVRQPFNVNSVAQTAACAALQDEDFIQRSRHVNEDGMAQIVAGLQALNLQHIPSFGNFVTFRVGDAARVNQDLLRAGIIVRPLASYAMPQWLRVTVGLPEENAAFLEALRKVLGEA